MSLKTGFRLPVAFFIPQAILIANTSVEVVAPADGYINEMDTIVQAAITTGGTLTVLTGPAGAVTVTGLSVAVANSATKGTRNNDAATGGSATRFVKKGDRIQVKPASFATGGAVDGFLYIDTSDTSPALPAA
ncbi:hypothetical protein [Aminobacter sp. HY435]|uniref:hypothetical protein n=1 Tax=Aminobacter sp. HY435 TaxID=2970917 RepID=UPI0022B96F09|nr:hypothetical protein [Aminobacter sp. HY435]